MIEQIILGIVQGIAEWLPVSSEGLIVLIKSNFFAGGETLTVMIEEALLLHFGTFGAALLYFRKEVRNLLQALFNYKSSDEETKKLLNFLILATLVSGALGILLLKILTQFIGHFESSSRIINLTIGCLLLGTAYLELKAKKSGQRETKNLTLLDGILLGITQGFAALPGLSRSGLTVSALLLRKFEKTHSLKLSFLMSLPIVLAGNVILHIQNFSLRLEQFVGMFFAFIFGIATIHLLLKLAEKINFGYFVLIFGLLMIVAGLV